MVLDEAIAIGGHCDHDNQTTFKRTRATLSHKVLWEDAGELLSSVRRRLVRRSSILKESWVLRLMVGEVSYQEGGGLQDELPREQ